MTIEQYPMLVDAGEGTSLSRDIEELLVGKEMIYWCDVCKVYHIEPEYGWRSLREEVTKFRSRG